LRKGPLSSLASVYSHSENAIGGLGMGLDEKALEAVRHDRFMPAMKDGKPVATRISIDVNCHIY